MHFGNPCASKKILLFYRIPLKTYLNGCLFLRGSKVFRPTLSYYHYTRCPRTHVKTDRKNEIHCHTWLAADPRVASLLLLDEAITLYLIKP